MKSVIALKQKAKLYHRKCIDKAPDDSNNYFNLGLAYLNSGNPKMAIDQFNVAFEKEKQDSDITYYLAMCYEQLEDYMASLEYLAASLEIDPRNASLNLEMITQPHFLRQDVV